MMLMTEYTTDSRRGLYKSTTQLRRASRRIIVAVIGCVLLVGSAWPGWPTQAELPRVAVAVNAAQDARTYFAQVRRDATALRAFLRRMPKGGELHTHLSGIPGPERLLELAAQSKNWRYYVRVPNKPTADNDPAAYAFLALSINGSPPQDASATFVPATALMNPGTDEQRAQRAAFIRANMINEGQTNPNNVFYGAIFQRRGAVTNNPEIMQQLVADAVRQAHRNRVSYVELQLSPFPIEPNSSPAEINRVINLTAAREHLKALIAAAQAANESFPEAERVEVRFMIAFSRTSAKTFTLLPLAFELAAGTDPIAVAIAGINIVGNEYSQDENLGQQIAGPEHLRDYILTLHRLYPMVRLSLHAGEGTKWDWHVRDSTLMGTERIGHGTNLMTDASLVDRELLRRNRILIEACLTSNYLLLGIPLTRHPFLSYLRAGIPVSLNTDDEGIFATDMTEEFARAVESHSDLSWEELKQLARASLDYAFVSDKNKQALLLRWEKEMTAFEAPKDWPAWLRKP